KNNGKAHGNEEGQKDCAQLPGEKDQEQGCKQNDYDSLGRQQLAQKTHPPTSSAPLVYYVPRSLATRLCRPGYLTGCPRLAIIEILTLCRKRFQTCSVDCLIHSRIWCVLPGRPRRLSWCSPFLPSESPWA